MYELNLTSFLKKASKIACNYCLLYCPAAGMPLFKITNCSRERRFCVVAETVGKLLEKGIKLSNSIHMFYRIERAK